MDFSKGRGTWGDAGQRIRHHLCRMSRHGDALEMTMTHPNGGCFEIVEAMPGAPPNSESSLEKELGSEGLVLTA